MPKQFILICLLVFSAATKADPDLNLDAYEGDVVLLDFWASWCIPCRRSFPWMNAMHEKYAKDGLHIVAVNLDRDQAEAEEFLSAFPASFDIVYDPAATIAPEYEVFAMPTSILIGRSGEILAKHSGFKVKRQQEYEAVIEEALEQTK